jgi:hypothetical protein
LDQVGHIIWPDVEDWPRSFPFYWF